jgi:hypothetical protein
MKNKTIAIFAIVPMILALAGCASVSRDDNPCDPESKRYILGSGGKSDEYPSPVLGMFPITPNASCTSGGGKVTILGANFTPGTKVFFGGLESETKFTSQMELHVVTPPHPEGNVEIKVRNECGEYTVPDVHFKYVAPAKPFLAAITPPKGCFSGGNAVRITGKDLLNTVKVLFNGVEPGYFSVEDDNNLVMEVPGSGGVIAGVARTNIDVNVLQRCEAGDQNYTGKISYTYIPGPRVDSIAPVSEAAGKYVTIKGVELAGSDNKPVVFFGDFLSDDVMVKLNDPNTLLVKVPAGGSGTVNVEIKTDCGSNKKEAGFTYQ